MLASTHKNSSIWGRDDEGDSSGEGLTEEGIFELFLRSVGVSGLEVMCKALLAEGTVCAKAWR